MEEEDLWDAVMHFREVKPWCDLCWKGVTEEDTCYQPKNGYCAKFRMQAKKDKVTFNMHTGIYQYNSETDEYEPTIKPKTL